MGGDSLLHYVQARLLAQGNGYASPIFYIQTGKITPGGAKPPIYTTFLAFFELIGIHSLTFQRVASAAVGALGIYLLGLVAWKIAGKRAGIIAAVLASAYPMMWINDGELKNDGFIVPFVALVMLAAYRLRDDPRPRSAALFGAAVGVSALTRSETLLLIVLVGVPLCFWLPKLSMNVRLKLFTVALVSTMAIVMPWIVRNLVSFEHPAFMSVGTGSVLLNGSCDDTYYGDSLGTLSFKCFDGVYGPLLVKASEPNSPIRDESDLDATFMSVARPYIENHADRLPVVMVARVGRMFEFYKPFDNVRYNSSIEDRGTWQPWAALYFYWAMLPFGLIGVVKLRRSGVALSPLLGPIVGVTITAAITFGIARYRAQSDAALVILAAVGIDLCFQHIARLRGESESSMVDAPSRHQ